MFIGNDAISPTNIIGGCIGEYKNLWDLDKINQYINSVEGIVKDKNSEIIFKKVDLPTPEWPENMLTLSCIKAFTFSTFLPVAAETPIHS